MDIWILTSEFPPHFGGGGISAYCRHFARALVEEAHEVTVFTRAPQEQPDVSEEVWLECYPVVRIPARAERGIANGLGHWHLLSYAFAREICRRLEAGVAPPDMIEVQDYGGLGYFLQKEKLVGNPVLANIPIVVMCHTPTFEIARINEQPTYRFPNYWIGRAELFSIIAADRAISPSRFLADRLQERTGREIDVCHLPVFDLYEGNAPSAREAQTDLLYVGRYEIRKGVLEMLAGMKAMWDAGENVRLLMVGGDTWWAAKGISVWNYIQARYSGYIERGLLRMWSSLDHDEVAGVMQQAKALLVPSLYENFPYVCMEAMSAGVPVIASRSGGQAEMVGDGETCGLVFDWSEPESFGRTVRQLRAMTEAERDRLGANARERIAAMTDPARFVRDRIALYVKTRSNVAVESREYPFLNRKLPAERRLPAYAPEPVEEEVRGVLSVVVPYYNLGRHLDETIASLAAATYAPIELVIVNDGSTDPDSLRVLEEIESRKWPFEMKVVNIPNGGLANARNVGGKAARGEYLAFLDADDTVRPDYYSRCIEVLEKYDNVSFVYSWVQFFGGSDDVWVSFDTEMPYMLVGNMLSSYHVMRRKDFLAHGINNVAMNHSMEDYEAWLRMVGAGCLGVSIPEILVDYRVRPDSMSRSADRNQVVLMRERIGILNANQFDVWGSEIFQLMNANGPGYLWSNGSVDYPPVGHLNGPTAPNRLSSLRWKFDPERLNEIAGMLDEPAVVWLIEAAMRRRLHRFGVKMAKGLMRLRAKVRPAHQD